MPKKAIDARIPALIRNGAQEKKRSFFVVVGDRQKDVIVNLYHILLNVDVKLNKSVLWAYKKQLLGFSRWACARKDARAEANVDYTVTERSAKRRSRTKSSEESATSIPKIRSSCSFRHRMSDMSTTKRRRRFWETHTACVFCRTSRASHQICWRGR